MYKVDESNMLNVRNVKKILSHYEHHFSVRILCDSLCFLEREICHFLNITTNYKNSLFTAT